MYLHFTEKKNNEKSNKIVFFFFYERIKPIPNSLF